MIKTVKITVFLILLLHCMSYIVKNRNTSGYASLKSIKNMREFVAENIQSKLLQTATLVLFTSPMLSYAVQGVVKPPSSEETIRAVKAIQSVYDNIIIAEKYSNTNDWQKIGDILSSKSFQDLEYNANILVRSEGLSAEEKKTLGTIKRYGVIADALIMIGGLANELKLGGIQIVEGNKLQETIIDEEYDNDNNEPKAINADEVRKYIKLAKGSLNDVLSIANKLL